MNLNSSSLPLFLAASLTFLVSGCITKAGPADQTVFLPEMPMFRSPEIPFQRSWWDTQTDFKQYRKIYIAPVNTDYLTQMNWWQKMERGSSIRKDLPGLALFTRQTFQEAFQKDPRHRFLVADFPHSETLVLEIALVEVVPTKTTLKALGWLPPFSIPMRLVGLGSQSTAAFEARMRSGPNGKILAMFADRESEKFSLATVKDFSWYGHAKGIIREWAGQFVQVCNKEKHQVIPDSSWFELRPW